ncbi:MAG: septation protein SepH, partial [Propionibacteriaceae bacterium]|nr:septation protein SepH [Propionibacteriaceae bacterium]
SPREIQSRIRGGATLAEVAAEAGVEAGQIEGFALPVIAEREHMTTTALSCAVRRRGDGSGHQRLQELITSRLKARSIDADDIAWDAWREPDLKWRLVGIMTAHERRAEFLFDPRGRFSIADNPDARWMIGEELPGSQDPDNENTLDFDDEFALVRATSQPEAPPALPGDDVPTRSFDEGPATSELDDLYDMLSGVSEDSVRIYVGLDDEQEAQPEEAEADETIGPAHEDTEINDEFMGLPEADQDGEPLTAGHEEEDSEEPPSQEALLAPAENEDTSPQPRARNRRRPSIPSWDEIMFGGGSR